MHLIIIRKKWAYWNLKQIDKKIKNEARLTKMGVKYIRKYKVFKSNKTRAITTTENDYAVQERQISGSGLVL